MINTVIESNQRFSRSSESINTTNETPRSMAPLDPIIRKRKFDFHDDVSDDAGQMIGMNHTPVKQCQLDLLITPPGNSYYKRAKIVPSSPTYSGVPNTPQHSNFNSMNNLSTPPTSAKSSPKLNKTRLHKPSVLSNFNLLNGSSNFFGDTCYSFNLGASSLNKTIESNVRASNWRDACQDKIKHEQNKQFKQFQMNNLKVKQLLQERYKPTNLNPPQLFQPKLFPQFNKLHSFIDGEYQKFNSIVNYPFSYDDKFNENQFNRDLNMLRNSNDMPLPRNLPLLSTNNEVVKLPSVSEILNISPMDKSVLHPLGLTNRELGTYNDLSKFSVSLTGDSRQYYLNQLPKRTDFGPIQSMSSFHEQEIEEDEYDEEPTSEEFYLQPPNPNYYSAHNSVLFQQPQHLQQPQPQPQPEQPQEDTLQPPTKASRSRKSSSSVSGKVTKKSNNNSRKSSFSSRKSSFNSNRGRPSGKYTSGPRTRSNSRERMTVEKLSTSSSPLKVYKNLNYSTSTVFTDIQRSPTVTSDELSGTQSKAIVEESNQHDHHSHNHNHSTKKCLSCGSSNSPCWRPSWDPSLGQLCNSCGLRYRKTKARCMNDSCLRIPAKSEWGLMQRRGKGNFTVGETEQECYKCLQCDFAMEVK